MLEAKDKEQIQRAILEKYPGTDPEIDIDWDIGEFFFKAGMQKVVEWINTRAIGIYWAGENPSDVDREWQAFLKREGIE